MRACDRPVVDATFTPASRVATFTPSTDHSRVARRARIHPARADDAVTERMPIAPPRAIPASLLVNRTTSLVPRVPTHARAALVAPCLDAFAVTGLAVVVVVVLVVVAIIPIVRSKK